MGLGGDHPGLPMQVSGSVNLVDEDKRQVVVSGNDGDQFSS